eukprot:2014952-Rhodomonas_salina.1
MSVLTQRVVRRVQHAADFKAILDNAKAGPKCKQLSLQILPKYMSRFPDLADAGLDILIDLFEENEQVSQQQRVFKRDQLRYLPLHAAHSFRYCRGVITHARLVCGDVGLQFRMKAIEGFKVVATSATGAVIIKLIGVLSQLMQSEDEKEVAIVNDSLVAALEKDVQATVGALLEHMTTDEAFRAKALGFMQRELIPRSNKLLNKVCCSSPLSLVRAFCGAVSGSDMARQSEEAQQAVAAQIKKIIAGSFLSSYARAMRCPVLTSAMLLPGSSAKEFTIFMKVRYCHRSRGGTDVVHVALLISVTWQY